MSTDESQVNGWAWKAGWHPFGTIVGTMIIGGILGSTLDSIVTMIGLGLLAGIGIWFWGTREINDNWRPLIEKFVSEKERSAERGIEVDDASTYTLTFGHGDSPPLVEPSRTYENTSIVLTDASANINRGAEYNMESRDGVTGGSNRELYYDQISAVESHQDGNSTTLEIRTSGGDSMEIGSTNTDTVDQALSDLRKRVRNAKAA